MGVVRQLFKLESLISKALKILKGRWADKEPDRTPRISEVERLGPEFTIAIYESELQAIGLESVSWDAETGGDLFGLWADVPIIHLASRVGPNAQRDQAHFRLDVDYLIGLSQVLEADWGLRYFGDWHSHHRLGLETPSTGDQRRIAGVAAKNNFSEMAEFIVTFFGQEHDEQEIKINPYAYLNLPSHTLTNATLAVLPGISPVRAALIANSDLPDQELDSFSSFSLKNLHIPEAKCDQSAVLQAASANRMSERLIDKRIADLSAIASGAPELYREPFGYIIAVPANSNNFVGFAFSNDWSHELLQIEWIDRSTGKTEEIPNELGLESLLDSPTLKKAFANAKKTMTIDTK